MASKKFSSSIQLFAFKNNSSKDLIDKFKDVINLDKSQIFIKKVFAKKKAGEFTLFNHYSNFEKILN